MKKIRPVKQHDGTDCAVACIACIARWHGLSLPLASIRQTCGAGAMGTTIKGIMDGCAAVNLDARPYKSAARELESIDPATLPAILLVNNDEGDPHFIVLSALEKESAEIMDPADGRLRRITRTALEQMWSGYLVLISPGEGFAGGELTVPLKERIRGVFSLFGREITVSTLLSIAYILLGISFSLFLQYFIDKVIPSADRGRIIWPAAAMALLSVLALTIGDLRTKKLLSAATGIDLNIISSYISHLLRLPVAFFSQRGAGEINSRIGDVYTIRKFVTEGLPSIAISLITLVAAFALMAAFHWKLALLVTLFVPLYCVTFHFASRVSRRYSRQMLAQSTRFERKCVEAIAAVRSIKYACGESGSARTLEGTYVGLCETMYRGGREAGRYSLLAETISKCLTITLLAAGSLVIMEGGLSIGTLVGFYAITSFFSAPLAQLVTTSSLIEQTRLASERLFEVMDLPEESRGGCVPPEGVRDLVFDDVTFSYPGAMNLLEHFCATFQGGRITAVKGASGCGKSSLAALAMRLYSPSKGAVRLGGVDISLFDLEAWRKKITIVPQDVHLADDTILYNITWERECRDPEKVARILVEVGLESLIRELPRGVMTLVGEAGCRLSGGQKQRIAIAAALYRESDILILDEATNSLDAASQSKMMSAIKRINSERGTTVIMITHKADEIPIADCVLQM